MTVISFSLWASLPPALNFALAGAAHARAIDRSRVERWFRETAFTRFRPYRSEGTWNGTDPLRLARAWAAAHATASSS